MNERYEVRRKIGQGGLGTVYQAYDNQLRREVAIKRLFAPVDAAGNVDRASTAEKLMREATALSRLNHQNIVSIFDVGVDEDGGYVVMELLQGETLTDTVNKGVLTLTDFHQVVTQTLEALIAAEAENMLHRDLKPSNIMVIWLASGRFLIKVLDFGLAKVSAQPALQTIDHNNTVLGSIFYMAPEQFERRELDFSTDLYSMGCIYYFCLSGKDPFTGRSVADVMYAHLEHRVTPLHEIRPDLPREICDWVMWLMARDMAKRPRHAKEALENFPLVEQAGGGVHIDPAHHFVIPRITAPVQPLPARPAGPVTGPVPTRRTASTRVPALGTTGSIPARAVTTSTRVPLARTSTVPTVLPPAKGPGSAGGAAAAPLPEERSRLPLFIGLGIGTVAVAASLIALVAVKPWEKPGSGAGPSPPGAPSPPDQSSASLTPVPLTRLAEGDEVQFSFTVRSRTDRFLRFGLVQRDPGNPTLYHGYAFDVEERDPLSLRIRRYSGEPASKVRRLENPSGQALIPALQGRNVKVSQLVKVDLRAKQGAGRSLTFTASLWDPAGQKAVYTATDSAAALTTIEEYGFRALPNVLAQIADQKFSVAVARKPAPASPPPSSPGQTLLLDDNWDTGSNPTLADDPDVPHDRAWQSGAYVAKIAAAKGSTLVNGSNALAVNATKFAFAKFPDTALGDGRALDISFACRVEGAIPSFRVVLVNKMQASRGYLVEAGPGVRLGLYEISGPDASAFDPAKLQHLHQSAPLGGTPAPALSQITQMRMVVTRVNASQARIEVTATLPGGKTASAAWTDSQSPAFAFSHFGVKPQGEKGRLLLDNLRIVTGPAPASPSAAPPPRP